MNRIEDLNKKRRKLEKLSRQVTGTDAMLVAKATNDTEESIVAAVEINDAEVLDDILNDNTKFVDPLSRIIEDVQAIPDNYYKFCSDLKAMEDAGFEFEEDS